MRLQSDVLLSSSSDNSLWIKAFQFFDKDTLKVFYFKGISYQDFLDRFILVYSRMEAITTERVEDVVRKLELTATQNPVPSSMVTVITDSGQPSGFERYVLPVAGLLILGGFFLFKFPSITDFLSGL